LTAIVFIVYCILLMWLFDFNAFEIDSKKDTNALNNPPIIIIKNINNINLLLNTLDSIRDSYVPDQIDLFLINDTDVDLEEILQFYKTIFSQIIIINKIRLNDLEDELDKSISNYVLSIDSGMIFSDRLIKKIGLYIENYNLSVIFFPVFSNSNNKKYIFHQLFSSFWQACKCSLINKNLYTINDIDNSSVLVEKNIFIELTDNIKINKFSQKLIMDPDLLVHDNNTRAHLDLDYLLAIYIGFNLMYFVVIAQFLAAPSLLYLVIIIIKILPEFYFMYAYYNRLRIKFPKVEFVAYSFLSPIYLAMVLISNLRLDRINFYKRGI